MSLLRFDSSEHIPRRAPPEPPEGLRRLTKALISGRISAHRRAFESNCGKEPVWSGRPQRKGPGKKEA